MIEHNLAHVAERLGGRITGTPGIQSFSASSIAVDSRDCSAGSVYIAKPGEFADGHDYLPAAFAAGAVLAIAEREVLDDDGVPYPAIIVTDAVAAMGTLAAMVLEAARAGGAGLVVVGITGSAGKTTTKDLLAGVLAQAGPTVAPVGSYNGEIGVPLTVYQVTEDTKFLVVEMGATHIGHIQYLASMVSPDIGVELMVGTAHAGEFGSVENIAIAKSELVQALSSAGTAVLNLADFRVRAMAEQTTAKLLWFSEEGSTAPGENPAHLQARNVLTNDSAQPEFDLHFPNGAVEHVASALIGLHHVNNLLAAAGAAYAAGLEPAAIAAGLSGQGPNSRWRMERTERADGVTVINDAYNANPESMRAALRTLAELGHIASGGQRRTWAVLGAMYELGENSILEHNALGQSVVRLNISKLVVIGKDARALHIGAINEGSWGEESTFVDDVDAAFELLQERLRPGDIVLFKSSRDAGLRYLGERIAAASPQSDREHGSLEGTDAQNDAVERNQR